MKVVPRWSIDNTAALNIIFVAILIVGWFSFGALRRESFPEFDLDNILITVPYPGAAPQEVEEGICQKIEEAVRSVEGVDGALDAARAEERRNGGLCRWRNYFVHFINYRRPPLFC